MRSSLRLGGQARDGDCGVDITKDPSSRKINLTLAFDSGPRGMPQCKGAAGFSILEENSWLTAKGSLVQDYQV